YRAGIEKGPITIIAQVDEKEFPLVIQQVPLTITMSQEGNRIRATVDSDAGPPANGTPIFFGSPLVGGVAAEVILTDGTATATYLEDPNPRALKFRWAPVFASAGRARGLLQYDRQQGPGIKLTVDREWLVGDAAGAGSDPGGQPVFHSQATAHVEGGEPGQTLKLVLGSTRAPAVLPVAVFPFDTLQDGKTPSAYGGFSGTVAPSVTLDTETPAMGAASFRFTAAGGVTLPAVPALELRNELGLAGEVRFDSVASAQKLLDKAGSWGVGLVLESG